MFMFTLPAGLHGKVKSSTVLPAMVGTPQDLCTTAASSNSSCVMLADLHATAAIRPTSNGLPGTYNKIRDLHVQPHPACPAAQSCVLCSESCWTCHAMLSDILIEQAPINAIQVECPFAYETVAQQSACVLTLWNARSWPSSARVTTHGISRYVPLWKLPGDSKPPRWPTHTQCWVNTWATSLSRTSGVVYHEEGGVEACRINWWHCIAWTRILDSSTRCSAQLQMNAIFLKCGDFATPPLWGAQLSAMQC